MSRFAPEMDRNGIQWPEPAGTWKQAEDITLLQTFAEKLVIPPDSDKADMLNSIPTPWSRLLLFENALYNAQHPAHRDVLDQWRGLLGLLALARPLDIKLAPSLSEYVIDLSKFAASHRIAKTFIDLQPHYVIQKQDVEAGKWQQFHLIVVDDRLLGASSPRTLVFTAIDHVCPTTVPFKNPYGRLSDPLAYFKRFMDQKYLVLLKQWIDALIASVRTNNNLDEWLGSQPAPPNKTAPKRFHKLLGLLNQWQAEIVASIPRGALSIPTGQLRPHFTLTPYDKLPFLPEVPRSGESDLLLATDAASQKKVVVCFRPDRSLNPSRSSTMYNEHGQLIQSGNLLICDGRWTRADEPLPESLDFLPEGWLSISDPVADLFEDHVIEVELPEDGGAAYSLRVGQKTFLYPFKKQIFDYFTPAELAKFTSIEVEPDSGYLLTLQLPLVKGRSVRAARRYEAGANELILINSKAVDHRSSELAMWPAFADKHWGHHFYFKRQIAPQAQPERNLDFVPVTATSPRANPDGTSTWYFTREPVPAFTGTLGGRSGLLLPRYEQIPPAAEKDYWNVSIDFGSTHTRAFYLQMQKASTGTYTRWPDARVEQLDFSAHAKRITDCDPNVLRNDFFALSGELKPPSRAELKTLLMQPVNDSARQTDWRPREGFTFMHWIQDGFDGRKLKSDIKWESSGNKNDLNSFLRCLMVMVQAEAALRNAEVIFVARSYPTAFNDRLRADHNLEWVSLGSFMNLAVESEMDKVLSEAVATARFLGEEVRAPLANNTVSLDIGGSTTDIAIWYGKRLRTNRGEALKPTLGIQESVKMAAGSVGRYLQSDPGAQRFLEWLVETVKTQGLYQNLNLERFAGRRLGYALMFYDILTYYELAGDRLKKEYNALIGLIKVRDEARGLVVHLIYLFGSLAYYAGLLARKVLLQEKNSPVYYLYFCGKGGTLITWIENYQLFAEKLFLAGLHGPNHSTNNVSDEPARAEVHISPKPKQEVGRGLLVELTSEPLEDEDGNFGLIDTKEHSVTVGETGYQVRENGQPRELAWDAELSEDLLSRLSEKLPSFDEMKELNRFLSAIEEAFKHQGNGNPAFDLNKIIGSKHEKNTYVDRLANRLLGEEQGSVLRELEQKDNPNALVEPLLITEMKVLLETISNNNNLFN